jgi:multidrug efflux pump subunit AcrA (membrane-fusion protein)
VKQIIAALALVGSLFIASCGMFGPVEQVQQQPNKTVYRSAEESPIDSPTVTAPPQKVPGE